MVWKIILRKSNAYLSPFEKMIEKNSFVKFSNIFYDSH